MIEHTIHGFGPRRVIALHGLFTTGDGFRTILTAFDPAEWTVVLPDLRGYGRSSDQTGPFDIETAAADGRMLPRRSAAPIVKGREVLG